MDVSLYNSHGWKQKKLIPSNNADIDDGQQEDVDRSSKTNEQVVVTVKIIDVDSIIMLLCLW